MPKLSCPGCGSSYTAPESAAGRSATCKRCGVRFQVTFAAVKPQPAPSIWDEIGDDYEVESPNQVNAVSQSKGNAKPLASGVAHVHAGGATALPAWHRQAERAFRAICYGGPVVMWIVLYLLMAGASEPKHYVPIAVVSFIGFCITMLIGVILGRNGIGFDANANRLRLAGLGLIAGGVLCGIVGLLAAMAISYILSGGTFVAFGGVGIGICMVVVGGLQLITGRDLRSQAGFTGGTRKSK